MSVILPAYNESTRLAQCAARIRAAIADGGLSAQHTELIVVDDGSTDDTGPIASRLFEPILATRLLRLDRNAGKGAAVRHGTAAARAPVVVFMDVDMSVDPRQIPLLLSQIDAADVVIGTRSAEGAIVESCSWHRKYMGRTFNAMVRSVTGLPYLDTQCGFKAFRTPAARLLFHLMRAQRFAFDVEVLVLARQLRMTIAEVGIHWCEMGESKVRSVADPYVMTRDLFRLRDRADWPDMPAFVVGPRQDSFASGQQVHAEIVSTLGPRFPVIPRGGPDAVIGAPEVVVLLPLCGPDDVEEFACRLEAATMPLSVRRTAFSFSELLALQCVQDVSSGANSVSPVWPGARASTTGWAPPVTPASGPVPA